MKIHKILLIASVAILFASCAGDSQPNEDIERIKPELTSSNYTLKAEPVAEYKSHRPAAE